jgi:hypothetical protein
MNQRARKGPRWLSIVVYGGLVVATATAVTIWIAPTHSVDTPAEQQPQREYMPRMQLDTSGFYAILPYIDSWDADASLEEISKCWKDVGYKNVATIDRVLAREDLPDGLRVDLLAHEAMFYCFEGEPEKAYEALEQARETVQRHDRMAEELLYTIIYFQGVTALRRGENDNCILCRGESSCILPLSPAAIHTNPTGSRLAIKHFTEYLEEFPDDLKVRWLLNLAHMTLGEYPDKVDPRYLVSIEHFRQCEYDIGRFRDIGHLVGVNRFDQAGGAIMDDFDNDGLLDIVVTTSDHTMGMGFYVNKGDGIFEDRTKAAGDLVGQLGGLYCVQTDYNNDGYLDVFIPRGAWLPRPIRPTLLENKGDGTFRDVTREAGLLDALNSNTASWADYDNDGFLDLFVCCERRANRLYRNRGDGTFQEVAAEAGVQGNQPMCKGSAWVDYDNDDYPDLFLNYYRGTGQLFHNNKDGTFSEVTASMGIDGPSKGFSCWAWDYDNDGWLDIFATSYHFSLAAIVQGMLGRPYNGETNKLFHNLKGKGFKDVAQEAGIGPVMGPMGSNFGDFDNDGFLDMYFGTGWPSLDALVPNRMFKNVAGQRFAEITASAGTGHLQKGHAVACGDWDRDGDVDVFEQTGGAVDGDKYHNVLYQNPGQGNNWLTVKLIGEKTNRAAIGARIKAVTAGEDSLTVYRHVSSGSSFGANPLEQTIGLGKAGRVALLEIHWPTSKTTQVFRDIAANQAIEITEFARDYRKRTRPPIPLKE